MMIRYKNIFFFPPSLSYDLFEFLFIIIIHLDLFSFPFSLSLSLHYASNNIKINTQTPLLQ